MLAAERKRRILEYVRQHHTATVSQLSDEFSVHGATIRRDLAEFEQEGLLKRTHGGVIMEEWTRGEPSFQERESHHLEEKIQIGKFAASLIEDGENIIIDSGTTTMHIASHLVYRSDITVITNDMNIAAELRDAPGVRVILTGGELYPSSYMLNGMFTDHMLKSLHVEKAFIGTPALHPQHGLMHPEALLVPAKKGMIAAAGEIIVVTDHSKIGKLALYSVAPNSSIHRLITGKEASDFDIKPFEDWGITVSRV